MKLPTFKRIFKTDYNADYQSLIEKLSFSINDGFQSLFEALNRKLTFVDNMQSTTKTLKVVVGSDGIPTSKTGFPLDMDGKILGTVIVRVQNLDNTSTYPPGAVQIDAFSQENKTININHITGLTANTNYQITVITIS